METTVIGTAAAAQRAGSGTRWLSANVPSFRRDYNRVSFAIRHTLSTHPLLELPRLAKVAEKLRQRGDKDRLVALGARAIETGTKFTQLQRLEALPDSIRHLEESGAWMKLSQTNLVDPEYGELADEILQDLEVLSGERLRDEITWPMLTVFMASPGVVTPYHIDHESNFLMQIRGEKDVCLFDPLDRSVLPEEQIEHFYSGNAEAARYHDGLVQAGTVYRLVPGVGVHHPPLAPHWVRNGDAVSVSLSFGFCTRSLDRTARIYQANLVLRRLGLTPTPPGRSALGDGVKMAAMQLLSKRHPATRNEMLFSGVRRLAVPVAALRRLRGNDRRVP
jgi:hypothetical protein